MSNKISPLNKTGIVYEEGTSSSQSENKETTKVINIQKNNQPKYTKSANFIKDEVNKKIVKLK